LVTSSAEAVIVTLQCGRWNNRLCWAGCRE